MPYAEVRDRMVACGLWTYYGEEHETHYVLGHVECRYGRASENLDYVLTGYVLLDRAKLISADQFDCHFCKKVMGPEVSKRE